MPGRYNVNDYVPVQDRINRFWREHPAGAIVTKLMSPPDDFQQCRYEAQVYQDRADQRPAATGYAFELATVGTRGPNDTNHEENCETSAIGRALANMGYATSLRDRPTREEMRKTQFAPDLDEGERIVDAPVARPAAPPRPAPAANGPRPAGPANAPQRPPQGATAASGPIPPSAAQLHAIRSMGERLGLGEQDLVQVAAFEYDAPTLEQLTGGRDGSASRFISRLGDDRDGVYALLASLHAGAQPALVDAPPAAAPRRIAHFETT